ncbi:conserved Plasmodium protein, unknown function [Plasmodium vinckei vinckei]|uniref:Uncharacterized protein n=1 Tax=Plasmodium vinckei vinckei TaxID=54757 RepID=A0A449C0F8_PLAVN|nr:conserved Plasmodium protein, unknown function [Plasmodium vinckei vinckei]KEG04081.1 hypothetical protein YYE_00983 [Plasmodium vinckei vinckei]VEV59121.1 conserved Plasmodium protein, unknown function [Plasmodium vinckei vinckei]
MNKKKKLSDVVNKKLQDKIKENKNNNVKVHNEAMKLINKEVILDYSTNKIVNGKFILNKYLNIISYLTKENLNLKKQIKKYADENNKKNDIILQYENEIKNKNDIIDKITENVQLDLSKKEVDNIDNKKIHSKDIVNICNDHHTIELEHDTIEKKNDKEYFPQNNKLDININQECINKNGDTNTQDICDKSESNLLANDIYIENKLFDNNKNNDGLNFENDHFNFFIKDIKKSKNNDKYIEELDCLLRNNTHRECYNSFDGTNNEKIFKNIEKFESYHKKYTEEYKNIDSMYRYINEKANNSNEFGRKDQKEDAREVKESDIEKDERKNKEIYNINEPVNFFNPKSIPHNMFKTYNSNNKNNKLDEIKRETIDKIDALPTDTQMSKGNKNGDEKILCNNDNIGISNEQAPLNDLSDSYNTKESNESETEKTNDSEDEGGEDLENIMSTILKLRKKE